MRPGPLTATALILLLNLACGSPAPDAPPGDPDTATGGPRPSNVSSPAVTIDKWACAGDRTVTSEHFPQTDELIVTLSGEVHRLRPMPAASGAKSGDDEVVVWSKGNEAFIDFGDGDDIRCVAIHPEVATGGPEQAEGPAP